MEKKQARLRRARKTRAKIAELKMVRLAVHRTNSHIYAQIFSGCGTQVLVAASTAEADVRKQSPNGGNVDAAKAVGKLIAERAKAKGIEGWLLTVPVSVTTAASRRWLRPPVRAV